MPRRSPTWVEIVGYQIEKVHTGSLATLLENPRTGPIVLHDLMALGRLKAEVVRGSVQREAHAQGGAPRTRVDLIATAEFRDGHQQQLAVETKVDSNCEVSQLTKTAAPEVSCVLLAVGITGLQWKGRALPGDWRLVDAQQWLRILDRLGTLPEVLSVYRDAIAWEVHLQQSARLEALGQLSDSDRRRMSRDTRWSRICDWAWLAEVRSHLRHGAQYGGKDEPRTGPVMYFGTSTRRLSNGVDIYLDLVVDGGVRKLVVKGDGGLPDDRIETWESLGNDLQALQLSPGTRQPRRRGEGNFRIATHVFASESSNPQDAAAVCDRTLRFLRAWNP